MKYDTCVNGKRKFVSWKNLKFPILLRVMNQGQKELICQSCGMPMHNSEDYGTNYNGSHNTEYCTYCFQKGKFTDLGVTLEEKIDKAVEMAVSQLGMNEDDARVMASTRLPYLKRWLRQ